MKALKLCKFIKTMIKPLLFCKEDNNNEYLKVLDQRLLPTKEKYLICKDYKEIIDAIAGMALRGAPLIGIAGAWACYFADKEIKKEEALIKAFNEIVEARPTAVNLKTCVERMHQVYIEEINKENTSLALLEEAKQIAKEDQDMCNEMAVHGVKALKEYYSTTKKSFKLLTHCNTGALATGGIGTALGVITKLAEKETVEVYATETRPYLQGARLTCWELAKNNIHTTLLPDSAVPYLMKNKQIDAVFVGADRIVKNGDTANKIGTYMLALAAKENNLPFYVVAPSTSFDNETNSGADIVIEERSPEELKVINGKQMAPEEVHTFNPAFDITPNNLITAFITEKGCFSNAKSSLVSSL
ncbi:MAG TPA: S-methyl-5-thioribose-1-phosphate isomerase [Vampirovibrionales bacterium]